MTEWVMTGSNALSCSCPASAAIVTVTSAPATENATWLTTSGITGFTLPGMIDDPAWRGGSVISLMPACGPDDSSRRSLQILDNLIALRFRAPLNVMKTPVSLVASMRSGAVTRSMPESVLRWRRTASA
jgi:hypothetical protein